jgi:hypothetical protein
MALLIDYAPPKRISTRGDHFDDSAIYSTLPGREGYLELLRMAGRIGVGARRVHLTGDRAHALLRCHEVFAAEREGARRGTPDEIRPLWPRPVMLEEGA